MIDISSLWQSAKDFIAVLMSLIAIFGFIITWRKYKPETRVLDAEASIKFQQAARDAAEDVIAKSERIKAMEEENDSKSDKIDILEQDIAKMRISLDERSEQIASLKRDLSEKSNQITVLEEKMGAMNIALIEEMRQRKRFENWARALAAQVVGLGGTPIVLGEDQ